MIKSGPNSYVCTDGVPMALATTEAIQLFLSMCKPKHFNFIRVPDGENKYFFCFVDWNELNEAQRNKLEGNDPKNTLVVLRCYASYNKSGGVTLSEVIIVALDKSVYGPLDDYAKVNLFHESYDISGKTADGDWKPPLILDEAFKAMIANVDGDEPEDLGSRGIVFTQFLEASREGRLAVCKYLFADFRDFLYISNVEDNEQFKKVLLCVAIGGLTDWFFGLDRSYTPTQMRILGIDKKKRRGPPDKKFYEFCRKYELPENREEALYMLEHAGEVD